MSQIPELLEPLGYPPEFCSVTAHSVRIGDDLMIEQTGSDFRICDLERGNVTAIQFQTGDEAEACANIVKQISNRSRHLATSRSRIDIERMQAALSHAGLSVWRNDISRLPGPQFPRFRLFVNAADYCSAKGLLANLE